MPLIRPSKLIKNRLLRNVTIRTETLRKTHGNLFFTLSYNRDEIANVLKSKLTRPNELVAYFTQRIIKPLNRRIHKVNQKAIYTDIKQKTNGRIRLAKVDLSSYSGRNVMIDVSPELNESRKWLEENRTTKMAADKLHFMATDLFTNLLGKYKNELNYQKKYLIIPFTEHYDSSTFNRLIAKKVYTAQEYVDNPTLMLLSDIRRGDFSSINMFDMIFLYNYEADVLMGIDPKNVTKQEISIINMRIKRLNLFNRTKNEEDLFDAEDPDGYNVSVELDDEDTLENQKEEIINATLAKISKELKIRLTDFSTANSDEQELIREITDKVNQYISDNKENASFKDLVDMITKDKNVRSSSARYLNMKLQNHAVDLKINKLNDIEIDVLDSALEDGDESELTIDPMVFDTPSKVDPSLKQSTTFNLDKEYNSKLAQKDLIKVLSSLGNTESDPLMLVKFNSEDTSDDRTSKMTYDVSLQSPTDKGAINFKIDVPILLDDSYFYINGNMKSMNKQLTRLPLVKTKPDTVEFVSNLNKITFSRKSGKISRRNAKLLKILDNYNGGDKVTIKYGTSAIDNAAFQSNYEYDELSTTLYQIKSPKYDIIFNRRDIKETYSMLDIPEDLIDIRKTPLGFSYEGEQYNSFIYIDDQPDSSYIYEYNIENKVTTKIADDLFTFLTNFVLAVDIKKTAIGESYTYSMMRFMKHTYPIFVVAGVIDGITNVLKRYNVEYSITNSSMKSNDWVSIKFKDCWLNYRDNIRNTLLLNILYKLNPEDFNFDEFDGYQPYKDFIASEYGNGVEIHARRMLKVNLGVMIDPITKEVLDFQKLPSDIIGVLLAANTLLTTNVCSSPMDMKNFRLRGNEAIYAVLYQILASEYIKYQKWKNVNAGMNNSTLKFSIPRNILMAKLMKMNNFNDISVLNPVLEALTNTTASPVGHRGINLSQAYGYSMRVYNDSQYGITSANSTPYSNPGVVRQLVYNTRVIHPRGYFSNLDNINQVDVSGTVGIGDLLSYRNAVSADPPRISMQIGQTKHLVQTKKSHKTLLGSGAQHTLPYLISGQFVFKAKNDGIIKSLDEAANCLIIEYIDGKMDAIDLNGNLVKNSSAGFYLEQKMAPQYQVGEKFKKNDILAYIPEFFAGKGNRCEYKNGYLARVAVASGDFCFEDATIVSERLANDMATPVTMMKDVVIGKNAIINNLIDKGSNISAGDVWLSYINSYEDEDTMLMMQSMTAQMSPEELDEFISQKYESKYTGRIADVKIYFNLDIEEYSESIQALIKKYIASVERRKKLLKQAGITTIKIPPIEKTLDTKIQGAEFPPEGGIIIQCFFEYNDILSTGSKITFTTSLKGVLSNVISNEEAPLAEDGNIIDAICSPVGVMKRNTMDFYSILYGNSVLIEVGRQIKLIYEKGSKSKLGTPEFRKKKQEIKDLVLGVVKRMDNKKQLNFKYYNDLFVNLFVDTAGGDKMFDDWAGQMGHNLDDTISLCHLPFEEISLQQIEDAAKFIKLELEQYILFRHAGKTVRSPFKVPVGYCPLKRVQQILSKKMRLTLDSKKVTNVKTGQMTKTSENRVGTLSDNETFALMGYDSQYILKELLGPRADNNVARADMLSKIHRDGFVQLEDLDDNLEEHASLNTLNCYMIGSGIRSDLVSNDLELPYTKRIKAGEIGVNIRK